MIQSIWLLTFRFLDTVTDDEFKLFFEKFGTLVDSVVMFDRDTGRSRGFGFITYEDPMVSRKLLMMGNEKAETKDPLKLVGRVEMQGKMCEVKAATPKERGHKVRKEVIMKQKCAPQGEACYEDVQVDNQFEMYGYNYPDPRMCYYPPLQYNISYGHHYYTNYPLLMNPAVPMEINPQLGSPISFVPPVGIPFIAPPPHPHGGVLPIEAENFTETPCGEVNEEI